MESNEYLTAPEWYHFLIHEVKLPPVAKDEIEKLAQALERHYMTKEGFTNLSADELKTEFNFDRRGLLNQFTEWKESLISVTTSVTKTDSTSNNNNETSSAFSENPLLSLLTLLATPVHQNNEEMAKIMLNSDTRNISQIGSNCISTIDGIDSLSTMVSQDDRVYYRCKVCGKTVWVAKTMSAFVEFPGCFNCQKQWLEGLIGVSKQN